jgi:catechol 2,3-dioxygenase-like lactoylglutathione lyase family enzyme
VAKKCLQAASIFADGNTSYFLQTNLARPRLVGKDALMKIEHAAFSVSDPVAMSDWYAKHLGLRVVRSGSAAQNNVRFLADDSGLAMIEIYRSADVPPPDYRVMHPYIVHLAFVADDVAAERARLVKAGAIAEGEISKTDAGDELCFLRDPWGFCIQLVKRAKPMLKM